MTEPVQGAANIAFANHTVAHLESKAMARAIPVCKKGSGSKMPQTSNSQKRCQPASQQFTLTSLTVDNPFCHAPHTLGAFHHEGLSKHGGDKGRGALEGLGLEVAPGRLDVGVGRAQRSLHFHAVQILATLAQLL